MGLVRLEQRLAPGLRGEAGMGLMKTERNGSGCPGDKSACSNVIFPAVESQAKVAQGLLRLPCWHLQGRVRAGRWQLVGEDPWC